MVFHHDFGTGGATQLDGSVRWPVWVGITNVPSSVSTASSASITPCAPPGTQPRRLSDVCTITVMPGLRPSLRRSLDSADGVTGFRPATRDSSRTSPSDTGTQASNRRKRTPQMSTCSSET